LDTLVLDSCQKIDVKEFENLKFCNQLSNLNAGFTNLDGETWVKVIKPPIVYIDISGIVLDLDHVKGLLKVCHSTLLTVHCGIKTWFLTSYPNFNQMVDPNTSNQKEASNFNLLYFIKGH
jgi:hypothetical protein